MFICKGVARRVYAASVALMLLVSSVVPAYASEDVKGTEGTFFALTWSPAPKTCTNLA